LNAAQSAHRCRPARECTAVTRARYRMRSVPSQSLWASSSSAVAGGITTLIFALQDLKRGPAVLCLTSVESQLKSVFPFRRGLPDRSSCSLLQFLRSVPSLAGCEEERWFPCAVNLDSPRVPSAITGRAWATWLYDLLTSKRGGPSVEWRSANEPYFRAANSASTSGAKPDSSGHAGNRSS